MVLNESGGLAKSPGAAQVAMLAMQVRFGSVYYLSRKYNKHILISIYIYYYYVFVWVGERGKGKGEREGWRR